MVLGHVELPEGTLCPLTNLPLRHLGKARVTIRIGGGPELSCPKCSKGRHYPLDFQETNPEIYRLILDESSRIKREYRQRQQEQEEEEEEEEEMIVELPVESEIVVQEDAIPIIQKEINDMKINFNTLNTEIAKKYKELVDKSPLSKTKKYDHGPMTKNQVWLKYNDGVTQTLCPVCCQNGITINNYSLGHIHPESKNGSNTIDNLIPICSTCNTLMGTQHLYYYAWNVYKRILWPMNTF